MWNFIPEQIHNLCYLWDELGKENKSQYLLYSFIKLSLVPACDWILHKVTDIDQHAKLCFNPVRLINALWISNCHLWKVS